MGYLMYYSAFIIWFDHFLHSGAEICQFFVGFLENLKKSKRHSEINWPLVKFTNMHDKNCAHAFILFQCHWVIGRLCHLLLHWSCTKCRLHYCDSCHIRIKGFLKSFFLLYRLYFAFYFVMKHLSLGHKDLLL